MICYVCKSGMQKQMIVKDDIIKNVRYICPVCQTTQEEEIDTSCSKYSTYTELETSKEV